MVLARVALWLYILFMYANFSPTFLEISAQEIRTSKEITQKKSRDHIARILDLNDENKNKYQNRVTTKQEIYEQISQIYEQAIKPAEDLFKFSTLNEETISAEEINAKPMVLLLGPWSTGKTTFIKYLLGIEESTHQLHSSAEPSTKDFVVISHGPHYQEEEGMILTSDKTKPYHLLQRFGMHFIERFKGIKTPSKILKHITVVDTPGIIEHKQYQKRGYSYADVSKWFIFRSSIILVMFDPTKLDVGSELNNLFSQLKGHEAKIRIILNKADTVSTHELMRIYGALMWMLAPLIDVVEPAQIYVGSFWSKPCKSKTLQELFMQEEMKLLEDINQIIQNQIESKIAKLRKHCLLIRIHAKVVKRFLEIYKEKSSLFNIKGNNQYLAKDIISHPEKYNVFDHRYLDISEEDLPKAALYQKFFISNPIEEFQITSCYFRLFCQDFIQPLENAISADIPNLLKSYEKLKTNKFCDKNSKTCNS